MATTTTNTTTTEAAAAAAAAATAPRDAAEAAQVDSVRAELSALEASGPDAEAVHAMLGEDLEAARASWAMLRYLRARSGNVEQAVQALLQTARWRLQYDGSGVEDVLAHPEVLERVLSDGRMYVSPGRDRAGRTVIVNVKSGEPASDEQNRLAVRLVVYVLEKAVKQMQNDAKAAAQKSDGESDPAHVEVADGKWVWIMDLTNYSSASSTPLSVTKETMSVFQQHYPERLAKCFIINAPFLFSFFWRLCSPFLDPVTRQKIVFCDASALPEFIAPDQLEQRFGGELDYEYNFSRDDLPLSSSQDAKDTAEKQAAAAGSAGNGTSTDAVAVEVPQEDGDS